MIQSFERSRLISLQQSLPFTVLKPTTIFGATMYVTTPVATVLTVYGIETKLLPPL